MSLPYNIVIDGNNFFVSTMMGVLANNPNTLYNVKHDDPRTDPRYGLFLHCLMAGLEHFCQSGLPTPQDLGYSGIVLCFDASNNWRKKVFPNYKAVRKARRKKENFDWSYFYDLMECLKTDILKSLPVYYCHKDGFEADDLIAMTVYHMAGEWVIVSADKDMMQLLTHASVYNPRHKVFYEKGILGGNVNVNKDGYDLLEHVVKGDSGDGIPNIFSDDDVFINPDKRNARISKKKMEQIKADLFHDFTNGDWSKLDRFNDKYPYLKRNLELICFRYIGDSGRYDARCNYKSDLKEDNTAALFHKYGLNKLAQTAFWQNAIEKDKQGVENNE